MIKETEPQEIFSHLAENRITERDRVILNEVLNAGVKNTHDPADIFARFEGAFAEKFGVRYGIAHNSGTSTLHSCLLAAGVGPGVAAAVPLVFGHNAETVLADGVARTLEVQAGIVITPSVYTDLSHRAVDPGAGIPCALGVDAHLADLADQDRTEILYALAPGTNLPGRATGAGG